MATERPDIETLIEEHTRELEKPIESRQVTRLERLVNAFHKLQETPSDAGDASYFYLGSYHGNSSSKVFSTQRKDVPLQFKRNIFCPHGKPDFPGWHRAYLYVFEKSLKAHDASVMLPFWNEASAKSRQSGLPSVFTEQDFKKVDGSEVRNPLYSFRTSELIDTPYRMDESDTMETFRESDQLVSYLSGYIVTHLKAAFKLTTYEEFSAGRSGIGNPHNSVHAYIGGWMGQVPLSGFDPVFWFHHCFIDNMYWQWQVINNQTTTVNYSRKHTQLVPFLNPSTRKYFTIDEFSNIENFGYKYPPFDVKLLGQDSRANRNALFRSLGRAKVDKTEGSQKTLLISAIRFATFGGTFTVEATAIVPSGQVPLGVQTVFRFAEGCESCDLNPFTEVSFRLKDIPQSEEERIQFKVRILMSGNNVLEFTKTLEVGLRTVHRVLGTSFQLEY